MAALKKIFEGEFTTASELFNVIHEMTDRLTFNQARRLSDFAGSHLPGRVELWQRSPKGAVHCKVIRPDMIANINANHRAFIRQSFEYP
jgi:hypothetical protein